MDNSSRNEVYVKNGELKEVRLVDYLYVVVKRRNVIFWCMGLSVVLSFVVLFWIVQRWYKSTTTIMPPKQKAEFSISSVVRSFSPFGGFGLSRASDQLYDYTTIISSRTSLEEIVRKFDLIQRYKVKNVFDAMKELQANLAIDISKDENALEISAYDTDSLVAADMANYVVEVLNRISNQLGTEEARNNREFIGKRLETTKEDLRNAEDQLRKYQEQSGVLIAPDQNMSSISAIAELYGTKAKKEIELAVMEGSVTAENQGLQQLKLELKELNKKIATFPEAGMESFRLYRNVAIQQKLLEILVPIFEQAKIEEQRDTPTILVLDKAVPASSPAKPRRLLWLLVLTIIAFVCSIFVVFLLDYLSRIRNEIRESENEKLQYLKSHLQWRKLFFLQKN